MVAHGHTLVVPSQGGIGDLADGYTEIQRMLATLFPKPQGVAPAKLIELADYVVNRVEGPRRALGIADVLPIGPTMALTEPRGFEGLTSDWAAYPAEQDPGVRAGRFFTPPEVLDRLRVYKELGFDLGDLDTITLHQYPAGTLGQFGVEGVPPELLNPPPTRRTVASAQRLQQRATRANQPDSGWDAATVAGGLAGLVAAAVIGAVGLAGLAAVGVAASATVGLDPAVLVAVSPDAERRPGNVVYLYLLAAWTWTEEGSDVKTVTRRPLFPHG